MSPPSLNEIVYFELEESLPAQRLCTRLGTTRLAWVEPVDASRFVGVVLSATSDDLAVVLRDVETWLAEEEIGPIPFEVDDRVYVLHPRRVPSREAA